MERLSDRMSFKRQVLRKVSTCITWVQQCSRKFTRTQIRRNTVTINSKKKN